MFLGPCSVTCIVSHVSSSVTLYVETWCPAETHAARMGATVVDNVSETRFSPHGPSFEGQLMLLG